MSHTMLFEGVTATITNWQCQEMVGNIQLWFNAAMYSSSSINGALESRYPSVSNGFNCPDY